MNIQIRRLRLRGITKNYDVSFCSGEGIRSLSIIAGEISTGKTSVLEMIDYCLGASQHPTHREIQRKVQVALLEIEANNRIYVIQRSLFSSERLAWVHNCSIDEIDQPHTQLRKPLVPPGSPDSLSTFLLDQCGLAGISLKEAPTQNTSETDLLSFRDVMWLCYLENRRLDDGRLLHDDIFMQRIKFQQVIAVIYGIHDNQAAQLGDQSKNLENRRRDLMTEIKSLQLFLDEQSVWTTDELEARLIQLKKEETADTVRLETMTTEMSSQTDFSENLRREYNASVATTSMAATILRDRSTLLKRLLPLRGQYAEDEKKLVFYEEARRLFDPLRITSCPACLQDLPTQATIEGGACSLCGQSIESGDEEIDVRVELDAVRARRRAIEKYISEVQVAAEQAKRALDQASNAQVQLQLRLDETLATAVAPFIAERDLLIRRQETTRAEIATRNQQLVWRGGLDRRILDRAQIDEQIKSVNSEIRKLQAIQPNKEAVIGDLSTRFQQILTDFGFPKLNDPEPPRLNEGFIPFVRGEIYNRIGSSGAKTLISLAWTLTIFERAIEQGYPHPGFLMIDSPQKNLKPTGDEDGDEFRDPAIVERVWNHINQWSNTNTQGGQVIVVDNAPPNAVKNNIVVRYSARKEEPPYGLIDDEQS